MYDKDYPEYNDWLSLANNLTDIPDWLKFIYVLPVPISGFDDAYSIIHDIKMVDGLCPERPKWPDLHGHFPYHLANESTTELYAPYFKDVKNAVKPGMMFNFFNQWDSPTGQYSQEGGRTSGSWLIDQMIKPYRLISWPIYGDRAYRMVYGVGGLDNEQKLYFKYDSTRKDKYCVSSWPIHNCGIALTCGGEEIHDFTTDLTKYQMIAYGCPSYSRTLGGHDPEQTLASSSGFLYPADNEVNLQNEFGYRQYVMWHGAQFRGILANQREYWRKFLDKIKAESK